METMGAERRGNKEGSFPNRKDFIKDIEDTIPTTRNFETSVDSIDVTVISFFRDGNHGIQLVLGLRLSSIHGQERNVEIV